MQFGEVKVGNHRGADPAYDVESRVMRSVSLAKGALPTLFLAAAIRYV